MTDAVLVLRLQWNRDPLKRGKHEEGTGTKHGASCRHAAGRAMVAICRWASPSVEIYAGDMEGPLAYAIWLPSPVLPPAGHTRSD